MEGMPFRLQLPVRLQMNSNIPPASNAQSLSLETSLLTLAKNWCYTEDKLLTCSILFTINNFSIQKAELGQSIASSEFSSDEDDSNEFKWYLEVFPNGDEEQNLGYVSIYLNLASAKIPEFQAKYKIVLLSGKNKLFAYQANAKFWVGQRRGNGRMIARNDLLAKFNHIQEDKLDILCMVTLVGSTVTKSGKITSIKVPQCSLVNDLDTIFESQNHHDFILSAGSQEFMVHKAILAGRSPVFSAMFTHEMEENQNNRVEIKDIAPPILKEMLRFIYTGKVSKIEEVASDLLVAADKYAIVQLRAMCEESLGRRVSLSNVLDILKLADLHSAYQLKNRAIAFIILFPDQVMELPGWNDLVATNPHLEKEILQAIVKTQRPLAKKLRIGL